MRLAPGVARVAIWGPAGYGLFDLTKSQQTYTLKQKFAGEPLFSPDCHYLFIPAEGEDAPWKVCDVLAGRETDEFRVSGYLEYFFPDGKTAVVSKDGKHLLLDPRTGKTAGPVAHPPWPDGPADEAIHTLDYRRFLGRFDKDGKVIAYRTPSWDAPAIFRLPADDRSRPRGGHPTMAISADGRYATVITTRSMYVLRLPPLPPDGQEEEEKKK
jgi:hypothetical protein